MLKQIRAKNRQVLIRFLTVGMQIPKESFSVINTGFIRLIQLLSNNNCTWMPFLPQIWYTGEKHPKVLSVENISWLRNALWAPAVIEANGKYYFYFGANNIYHESEVGGIGVAVADRPEGPFKDALGKPLIGKIVNGAQPIDQFVFKDDDGQYYMYYGGWGHCNMVKMGSDLISIVPFEDGTTYKEVTPENYIEGPFMLKHNGKYYFMWSEGDWTGPDYCVAYAIADSAFWSVQKSRKDSGAGH